MGFKKAGFDIVWANELDHAACETYRYNLGSDYLVEEDIKSINKKDIPYFDVLTAGFPCQPFSLAGPHKGFADRRGNLFYEIIDVAREVKPKVIFLENVSNLIDHDRGKTFITMFNALSELNYIVRYSNLPSDIYANTPQTRNRTYVVAFSDQKQCDMFCFPKPVEKTIGIFDIIDIHTRQKDIYYYNPDNPFYERVKRSVKRKDSIYRVHDSGIHLAKNHSCPTLTASMGTRENFVPIVIDDYGYRKLTVRECLDFQRFPNEFWFPKGTKISDAYKQIGNSVCVEVIESIAREIIKLF